MNHSSDVSPPPTWDVFDQKRPPRQKRGAAPVSND